MENIPIKEHASGAPPETPEAQRSLVSALGADLNQVVTGIVTGVGSGVATALALHRIEKGQGKPRGGPPTGASGDRAAKEPGPQSGPGE